MIALYNMVETDILNTMLEADEDSLHDGITELSEEDINGCNLEMMWDALHYLLTDVSASEPIENDLLSEAIVGTRCFFEESDNFIAYSTAERVVKISEALNAVDFEKALEKFSPEDFTQKEIYTDESWFEYNNLWIDAFRGAFEELKDFYQYVADNSMAVIVRICD